MKHATRTASWLALMIWHLAGLSAVGLIGEMLIGRSILDMPFDQRLFMLAITGAFLLAATVNIYWLRRRSEGWSILVMAVVILAAFGGAALGLIVVQAPFVSRWALLAAVALTLIVLTLARWLRPFWLTAGAVALLVLGIGSQAASPRPRAFIERMARIDPKPQRSASVVETRYGPLSATYYDNYFPVCDPKTGACDYTPRTGGGIDALGDGYLVATGEGALFYAVRDAEGALAASRLPFNVPINDADLAESGESDFARNVFRVSDILVEESGGETTVFASHHIYDKDADCVALRLSVVRGTTAHLINATLDERWDTLYQTKPCIRRPAGPAFQVPGGEPHPLQQSGGRLARLDATTLLMTVGDHNLDGVNADTMAAQDLTSDYGKTLAIDLERRTAAVFTLGHRNAQGLHVTKAGDIWLTEHGPQGGDELNHLVRGTNYGWPFATYGTRYGPGQHTWPIGLTPDQHRGFEEPVYSWVPSIGVSSVIAITTDRFPRWQGDLLIASLRESLIRARVRSGRVVTFEPVRLRSWRGRIRDLVEDRDGNVLVWLDDGVLAFLEPGAGADVTATAAPQAGNAPSDALFNACAGCHALADGSNHGIGPDLAGVINRPIGGSAGFAYSPAMSRQAGRWTLENLDRFLANPQSVTPGTTMSFSGLPSAADRAQIIAHLKAAERSGGR